MRLKKIPAIGLVELPSLELFDIDGKTRSPTGSGEPPRDCGRFQR
uniref:Uncharacterized protein n=1 Tax=Candidatus Kentrum sp. MB TaxID=2138164 RepID=A0A451BFS8_9GAMM|nr:MAG: hypothetical protein BECKMB1821H_GA0114242_11022 [Candidatus Kentron sp. MB]